MTGFSVNVQVRGGRRNRPIGRVLARLVGKEKRDAIWREFVKAGQDARRQARSELQTEHKVTGSLARSVKLRRRKSVLRVQLGVFNSHIDALKALLNDQGGRYKKAFGTFGRAVAAQADSLFIKVSNIIFRRVGG